jgi:hypothetical protein
LVIRTPAGVMLNPLIELLPAGSSLYRVHDVAYPADSFNPGYAPAWPDYRFSFFGDPPVPALYAADTVIAALSETLLRDVPYEGGSILLEQVEQRALSAVTTVRELRMLQMHGDGFRRHRVAPQDITLTSPRDYPKTVLWGQAAYDAGLDGIVWMSRHHNTSRAYVFFDRPGQPIPLTAQEDWDGARAFSIPSHLDGLASQLNPLGIDILDPS